MIAYRFKKTDHCVELCRESPSTFGEWKDKRFCLPRFQTVEDYCLHKCLEVVLPDIKNNFCLSGTEDEASCKQYCQNHHYSRIEKALTENQCQLKFSPQRMVCGPDGLPYASACHLASTYPSSIATRQCSYFLTDLSNIDPVSYRKCKEECADFQEKPVPLQPCGCPQPDLIKAVCMSDRKVYSSICLALCTNPSLSVISDCQEGPDSASKCVSTCQKTTAIEARILQSTNFMCATDGKVYTSLAAAQAANNTNQYLVDCPTEATTAVDCQPRCTLTYCLSITCANSGFNSQLVCASNGRVYTDFCRNNCYLTTPLSVNYICPTGQTAVNCQSNCTTSYCNMTICGSSTYNGKIVCDTSGVAHTNFCVDQCLNSSLTVLSICATGTTLTACQTQCTINQCLSNTNICGSAYANRYTCATNNQVYYSFCNYFCADRSLIASFLCDASLTQVQCQSQCTTQNCVSSGVCINSVYNGKLICGSDKAVHTDFCTDQCVTKTLTAVTECPAGSNTTTCQSFCTSAYCNNVTCNNSFYNGKAVCANDGQVYFNFCAANCFNPNGLSISYLCPSNLTTAQCQAQCISTQCTTNCANDQNNGKQVCASNGVVYTNYCASRCANTALSILFICDSSQSSTCSSLCTNASCQNNCTSSQYNGRLVCGNNGLVYSNFCNSTCANSSLLVLFVCPTTQTQALCQSNCNSTVCNLRCLTSSYNGQFVCANDGNVYTDFCLANCQAPNTLSISYICNSTLSYSQCSTACNVSKCQSNCANSSYNGQMICANNGQVYTNYCSQLCSNSSLSVLLTCSSTLSLTQCQSQCNTSFCQNQCSSSSFNGQNVCATNGQVYSNFCVSNCLNPNTLTSSYVCSSSLNLTQCQSNCTTTFCNSRCSSSSLNSQTVCATNGQIYVGNFCSSSCLNPNGLTISFVCNSSLTTAQCQSSCSQSFCQVNCTTSSYNGYLVCATNGQVYSNFCNSQCLNTNLTVGLVCSLNSTFVQCQSLCTSTVCQNTCANSQYNTQNVCSTNGTVYSNNFCLVSCQNPSTITFNYVCASNISLSQCQTNCRSAACKSNCSTSSLNGQNVCANDGRVYTDFCVANCNDPNLLSISYVCSSNMTYASCQTNCQYSKCLVNNCTNSFTNGKLICGSDGQIYSNFCASQCNNTKLQVIAECPSGSNTTSCQSYCKSTVCSRLCAESVYNGKNVCTSNGAVYTDYCTSECLQNSTLTIAFVCASNLTLAQCQSSCNNTACQISSGCANSPYNNRYVCANNTMVYSDFCSAVCTQPNLTLVYVCPSSYNSTQCQTACSQISCQKMCTTSSLNGRNVCGTDGIVYNDFCNAICLNPNTLSLAYVCPTNQTSTQCQANCGANCTTKCASSSFNSINVCANNGQVYSGNFCTASCSNSSLSLVFTCASNVTLAACQSNCSSNYCQIANNCNNSRFKNQLVCGNDKKIYDNFCAAQCSNSSLTFIMECLHSNATLCQSACDLANCLEVFCANSSLIGINVCANDGRIYNNFCDAYCYEPNTLSLVYNCPSNQTAAQCQTNCAQRACNASCPATSNLTCATDGNVYSNFCTAKCANSSLVKFMDCPAGLSTAQCLSYCSTNNCMNNASVCSPAYTNQWTCAVNGSVYYNFCSAFCSSNMTLQAAFICPSGSNQTQCQKLCTDTSCATSSTCKTSSLNGQRVCGSDGNIYTNFCYANCLNPNTLSLSYICPANVTTDNCTLQCLQNSCINNVCTNSIYNGRNVCASDGKIYSNFCATQCAVSGLSVMVVCNTSQTAAQCQSVCLSGYCSGACNNSVYNGRNVCANTGQVFAGNYCMSSCQNPNVLSIAFVCSTNLTLTQCQASCNNTLCEQTCNNSVYNGQYVCATNRVIYSNFCQTVCLNPNNVTLAFVCPTNMTVNQCQAQCNLTSCDDMCANSVYNGKLVCGSDGQVYSNFCVSQCSNPNTLALNYVCPTNQTAAQCQASCNTTGITTTTNCTSQCTSSIYNGRLVCASDGQVYSNYCIASCQNPNTLSISFVCSTSSNLTQCQLNCNSTVCQQRCIASPYNGNYVCAKNGQVYSDFCTAVCQNPNTISLNYVCAASQTLAQCQSNCSSSSFNSTQNTTTNCSSSCATSSFNGINVCGSDGKVYTDICTAICQNPNTLSIRYVCSSNITLAQCQSNCTNPTNTTSNNTTNTITNTTTNCSASCATSSFNGVYVCGSDGQLYTNICTAICQNPNTLSIRYVCSSNVTVAQCQSNCTNPTNTTTNNTSNTTTNCSSTCANSIYNNVLVCGSTGQLYSNFCQANCANPNTLSFLFVCPSTMTSSQCQAQCTIATCQQVTCITSSYNNQLICASDGTVYTNFCSAQCNNTSLAVSSICASGTTQATCQASCSSNSCSNSATCAGSPYNGKTICGNDGKAHSNFCQDQCNNSSLSVISECAAGTSLADCQTICTIIYCNTFACISSLGTSPICGSDGIVYNNACVGSCTQPLIMNVFTCSSSISISQCRANCVVSVTNIKSASCYSNCLTSPPATCTIAGVDKANCCVVFCYN